MQYVDPSITWSEWTTVNADVDMPDATRLAALREYIVQTARDTVAAGEATAEWANKKLAVLGITDRVTGLHMYTLEAPVTGTMQQTVYAPDRAAALDIFDARVHDSSRHVSGITAQGDPVFTAGPEDPGAGTTGPDDPQTVAETLSMLRQVIALGVLAGPKFCDSGANRVLASYGLAPIPERKQYTVTRPVEAEMRTTVEAYDEASAAKVAGWRWDNSRTGYTVASAKVIDSAEVTVTAS